ncbi:MAG: ATP-binding protein [Gammaproteobacteria bacterium]|nr:ATP-binding protein [Gammaproteobacteria bacterium]MDH3433029.1 ATP-binding protein [Gammaproteobacteria bacterium]
MMQLPACVVHNLQDEYFSSERLFCFLIDENYALVQIWGDAQRWGLDDIPIGHDMRDAAVFLVGCVIGEPQALRFVRLSRHSVAHVHLIPDGRQSYVVLIDASDEHDPTQAKQQKTNELRLMHARQNRLIGRQRELISELIEIRSELDHHRQEAERSSANKSRFIAMMSHEFRTPLASIINYAQLAQEQDASRNDIQKSVETIERSARHLTSLVEALLDDASLSAGRLELVEEQFDCHNLFEDLARMMAPMAAEKGLSFATFVDSDVPKVIFADEVRFRQILINLLGNAVKFTQEGGVRLKVTYSSDRLVVTVSDTGPGISSEDQEKVFKAFERGSKRSETGAGLGLTITLRLVQLMGGEVSLDSQPDEGCTVSIYIPVNVQADPVAAEAPVLPVPDQDALASRPLSILICDDDDDMIALVEHYLHRSGYGLIATSDSSDAIAKTIKYDPDLVLMDCNVPGIGGVGAAKLLRQQGYEKPIVALTASRLNEEERRAFTRFFRKPAPMQELLVEIKRLTH